jgi:hypothetical protein
LDRPDEIKKQFGVGYKLIIEPKSDQINPDAFAEAKLREIDPVLFSVESQNYGVKENNDSTSKKLIYQLPFKSVQYMSDLLNQLE